MADQAVHAGDADRRDQAADGGRDQAHQQGDQHRDGQGHARVKAEGLEGYDHQQEDDRHGREEDRESNLVGGFLAPCPFDQTNHSVQETFPGIRSDTNLDLIGEDSCPSGHRASVATRLPDDGGRFAGDGRFIHCGHALDDFPVRRYDLPCGHKDKVIPAEPVGCHRF